MKETLSLLMDAELDEVARARAIKDVGADPDLCAAWERYHVIRLAMRHEIEWTLPSGFSEQVAARIDREGHGQEVHTQGPGAWRTGRGGWATRFAIAASVAAVVLVGLRVNDREVSQGTAPAVVASADGAAAPQILAPFGQLTTVQDAAFRGDSIQQWRKMNPQWRQRLSAYLLEHNELAPQAGGDLAGYVRIVGYGHVTPVHVPVKK